MIYCYGNLTWQQDGLKSLGCIKFIEVRKKPPLRGFSVMYYLLQSMHKCVMLVGSDLTFMKSTLLSRRASLRKTNRKFSSSGRIMLANYKSHRQRAVIVYWWWIFNLWKEWQKQGLVLVCQTWLDQIFPQKEQFWGDLQREKWKVTNLFCMCEESSSHDCSGFISHMRVHIKVLSDAAAPPDSSLLLPCCPDASGAAV